GSAAADGRSRGKGGAPAFVEDVLTPQSGAPPFPLRSAAAEGRGFLWPKARHSLEVRAAGWESPLGEIKEEAEGRGTFAQRAPPPGKNRPPEAVVRSKQKTRL